MGVSFFTLCSWCERFQSFIGDCILQNKSRHTNYLIAHALLWRHNERDGVSNHQPHDCLPRSIVYADQRKHQSSASLAFVRGIHRSPVNSPHKGPVTWKMCPFDDIIMECTDGCRVQPSLRLQAISRSSSWLSHLSNIQCLKNTHSFIYQFPLFFRYQCDQHPCGRQQPQHELPEASIFCQP